MKLRHIRDRLLGGESQNVFRGMVTLAMGSGMARLVGLAAIPVLTRIYEPSDYGVLSIYVAMVSIIAPVLSLRYVLALPLPRKDSTALYLLYLSAVLILATASIASLLLWLYGEKLFKWMSMDVLAPWWWLIVFGAMANAIYEALNMWAIRKRNYRIVARTQLFQALLGEGLKLLLGILAIKPLGLMVGQLASYGGGISSLLLQFGRELYSGLAKTRWSRVKAVAYYYRAYPTYRILSQTLLVFSMQAPLILTAAYFDAAVTGQLSLALMALALPVNLLGDSMSKAYYAEISEIGKRQPEKLRQMTYRVIRRLVALSIVPALVIIFCGELIFEVVFGPQWESAGKFASILGIYLAFQFVQKPVSYLMFVFEGQRQLLYLNIQRALLTVAAFYVGYETSGDVFTTILIYGITLSAHYVFSIVIALKKIPRH